MPPSGLSLSLGVKFYVLHTCDLVNFTFYLFVRMIAQRGGGGMLNFVSLCEFRSRDASFTGGSFFFLQMGRRVDHLELQNGLATSA